MFFELQYWIYLLNEYLKMLSERIMLAYAEEEMPLK